MNKKFEMHTSPEGRIRITSFSFWRSWKVSLLLKLRYGFHRDGKYIAPVTDEAVYPSYVKDELSITSGWDNWFGYDWLAGGAQTDDFLEKFYDKHCHGK